METYASLGFTGEEDGHDMELHTNPNPQHSWNDVHQNICSSTLKHYQWLSDVAL